MLLAHKDAHESWLCVHGCSHVENGFGGTIIMNAVASPFPLEGRLLFLGVIWLPLGEVAPAGAWGDTALPLRFGMAECMSREPGCI